MTTPADEEPPYQLRPATDGDLAFMRVLYGHTREDELAVTGWTREQKDAFLDHQFGAQTEHYRQHRPAAVWQILVVDGNDAGRLVIDRRQDDHRIVDVTLLPDFRGRGIGTSLLRTLQRQAAAAGCVLSIHVEVHNPAMRLYERLGFRPVGGEGPVYQLMEWRASC
jgi:ribosomal protein S18 acetylase RimI-like enzyme